MISFNLAEKLLTQYGSPLYVYQNDILKATIQYITQAIPYQKTKFHFASVTNGNIALLKIFHSLGWGLHANTPGDVYLGLKAGFSPDQIVYSGSNLNPSEMETLLNCQITTYNLDSIAQLNLLTETYQNLTTKQIQPRLGLRLNIPELTGESRIGVRLEEFPTAIKIAESAGLKLTGIHFYRGTGTNATKAFIDVIQSLLNIGKLLPHWQYLDFGGGFGYPYQKNGVAMNWELFGNELTQYLSDTGIDLIIEPGRAAIARCGTLLTKVISLKWQDDKQIVGVDTTVGNISVPSVHGGYREIVSYKNQTQEKLYITDVCGNTTYSRDYLGKNCNLPKLEIGDILAILDVGAYGYAMSSHFLHRPRPAEVLLEENSQHRLIRQREDYSVLLENQIL